MTDDRGLRTRLMDHEVWVAVIEDETPNEVMGYSRVMLLGEIAAAVGLSLAYAREEHPILQRYKLDEVVESITRTLRFDATARGTAAGSTAN